MYYSYIKKDFIFKAIYIHKMVENSGCKYKGVKNAFKAKVSVMNVQ